VRNHIKSFMRLDSKNIMTEAEVKSYLKTRKGTTYYFKFPEFERTLVVEITGGVGKYWPDSKAVNYIRKQVALKEAVRVYNKRRNNED